MTESSRRRQTTEDRLLDALETVMVREGIRGLSLNAIVEEAGVGKPLLYRYFGSLPGLLTAWAERRANFVGQSSEKSARTRSAADGTREFVEQLADSLVARAAFLRAQPVMLEMLAEELTARSDLSEAFASARRKQAAPFIRAMLKDRRYVHPLIRGKIIVLYAAICYFAMRAARAPFFMGLRLDTRKGWNEAMDMIKAVALAGHD